MDENEILEALANIGLDVGRAASSWNGSLRLLAALDAVGRDGANALVKIDGERSTGHPYTVVISGGRLGEHYFRKDGEELQSLLCEALSFYACHASSNR